MAIHTGQSGHGNPSDGGPALAAHELDWREPESMDEAALCLFIEHQVEASKLRRQRWECDATRNLAWVEGLQDHDVDRDTGELTEDGVQRLRRRGIDATAETPIMINALRGIVEQRIALLFARPATLYAIPESGEDDDLNVAYVETKLLQFLWYNGPANMRRGIMKAMWEMYGAGVSFIYTCWDPTVGVKQPFRPNYAGAKGDADREMRVERHRERVAKGLNRQPEDVELGPDGAYHMAEGGVVTEFPTGFDVSEPEFATEIEECDWIIHSRWRSLEYLRARYGREKTERIDPDQNSNEYLSQWRQHYGAYSEATVGSSEEVPQELVLVHTLWRPVRPWSPQGALVTVACNVVLHQGPHPYPHGELPFVRMVASPSRMFRPLSLVGQIISLQADRNYRRTLMSMALQRSIAPKLLAEESVAAYLTDEAMDRQPRIIVVPDGALQKGAIRPMDQPRIPPDAWRADETDRRDMGDVGQTHDSTTGRGESAQQSGRHAAILLEADSRASFMTRELLECAIAKAGAQAMWIWRQYVTSGRTLKIAGPNADVEVLDFQGSDLGGNVETSKRRNVETSKRGNVETSKRGAKGTDRSSGPHEYNVRVLLGVDADQEIILDQVQTMTSLGYWSPDRPEDRLRVERLLGDRVGGERDEASIQRRNAAAEHRRMMAGKPVRAALGDQDAIHLDEHYRWTTTAEYRIAVRKRPALAEELRVHATEHQYAQAEKALRPEMIAADVKAGLVMELQARRQEENVGTSKRQNVPGGNIALPMAPMVNPAEPAVA